MKPSEEAQKIRDLIILKEHLHRMDVGRWRHRLDRVEKAARGAYARSIADLHNLHTKSWEELSQEQRQTWLETAGG